MIGIVVVAHSEDLARGLVAMVHQAAPRVPAGGAGGLAGGRLGTNARDVEAVIRSVLRLAGGDGVLVLLDLGSAAMALEIALEALGPAERERVTVTAAPLVEGAVIAAVTASGGASMDEVRGAAERALDIPKIPGG